MLMWEDSQESEGSDALLRVTLLGCEALGGQQFNQAWLQRLNFYSVFQDNFIKQNQTKSKQKYLT